MKNDAELIGGIRGPQITRSSSRDDNSVRDAGMVSLFMFLLGIGAVILLLAGRQLRRIVRRRKGANADDDGVISLDLQCFRDVNPNGAFSPNGNMLFSSFPSNVIDGELLHDVQIA
jgi:hypothetical protein